MGDPFEAVNARKILRLRHRATAALLGTRARVCRPYVRFGSMPLQSSVHGSRCARGWHNARGCHRLGTCARHAGVRYCLAVRSLQHSEAFFIMFTIHKRRVIATAIAVVALAASAVSPTASASKSDGKAVTLTLLHNNDGESSLDTSTLKSGSVTYRYGGIAAFKSVYDREVASARAAGNAVFGVYAGDSFLASKSLICSQPADATSKVKPYDARALREVGYDALVLGNHEFDYSPSFLSRYLKAFAKNGMPTIPVLSGNMEFSKESSLSDLIGPAGQISNTAAPGKNISQWLVYTDAETGAKIGVVTAVTPLLPTISSPGKSRLLTATIDAVAKRLQKQINALQKQGINKIVLVSHLQDLNNDKALVAKLRGVDIAVGGGGDELLQSDYVANGTELLPGESAPAGTYPRT